MKKQNKLTLKRKPLFEITTGEEIDTIFMKRRFVNIEQLSNHQIAVLVGSVIPEMITCIGSILQERGKNQ